MVLRSMKKILIISCCLLWASDCFAETKVVRVPVLNVRSCPSTDCRILRKLSSGDKVEVSSVSSGWAHIENGYVINRSLRQSYAYLWWYVFGILFAYLGLHYIIFSYMKKCPECGKWGALEEIDRECIERIKSNIKKVAYTHYKNHTRRREYIVPATKYRYEVTRKCSQCGKVVKSIEEEKLEN